MANRSSSKILVIGETGSGKSTVINYLTNYFKQGTLRDLRVAIETKFRPATEGLTNSEANTANRTKSQTINCSDYHFKRRERNYVFLDTPGLSDTRGTNQDDLNIDKIIQTVETFDGITCVLIVVNGTVPRLTANIQNVIVRLQGFLPDVIMEHVIVILTNAFRHTANADLDEIFKDMKSKIHPFYMQNSAFSTDPSKWDQNALKSLQSDWDISMSELKNLVDLVDSFEVKSVAAFSDMRNLRDDIKSMMHNARLEVENIQKMQDEIAALKTGMKGYDDDLTKNKDYTRKIVAVAQLVDAPYHSTICAQCNHVCHDNCGVQETFQKGSETLKGCSCMSGDKCGQCKGHCSYTQHYHARKTMSNTNQTVDEVLHDIKAKFDNATTNKKAAEQKLTTTADQKKMLENALLQKNAEIKKKCLELKKHCGGFNIVAELNIMIQQLETSKHNIRDLDALKQTETFINGLKGFCNQLEKDRTLTATQHGRQMTIVDNYRPGSAAGRRYATNNNDSVTYRAKDRGQQNYRHPPSPNPSFDHRGRGTSQSNNSPYRHHPYHPRQNFPQQRNTSGAPSDGKSIYVGGFPEGALNARDLQTYFASFGNVTNCFVAIDDGKLKDYGFVNFDNYNTVTDILKTPHRINGYTLKVGRPRENISAGPVPPLQKHLVNAAAETSVLPGSSGTNLYVSWAPEDVLSDRDLRDYLSNYGTILSCHVPMFGFGKFKNFGFVEFAKSAVAAEVMNNVRHVKRCRVTVAYNRHTKPEQKRPHSPENHYQDRGPRASPRYSSTSPQYS